MTGISNDMKISMSDMFYLGGPLSLRGFEMRGVGPQSESNALGSSVSINFVLLPCYRAFFQFVWQVHFFIFRV